MDSLLGKALQQAEKGNAYTEFGVVDQVIGLLIESKGPQGKLGDLCEIHTNNPTQPILKAEVIGFREGKLLLMPLGEMENLAPGCKVLNMGAPLQINTCPEMVGRVIDSLGNPLDGRFDLPQDQAAATFAQAPHPLNRREISEPLALGIRAVDGFITVGKGQRVGIFSGSGVGKSTTLGMMARNTEADLSVIAMIGERGREVRDFIDHALGEEGLKRSIVVVSTSEQPALLKIKAALVATTIAEYFREQGKDVLLMMDSLTRVAMALREVGLVAGEPPANRGYTPSVFSFMPKLVERAGTSDKGSITALYTVLVEGDDFNEPVSDMVRGLIDGHILLSRDLAEQNHFPAVDVQGSISRLMLKIVDPDHRKAAGKLRDMLATYRKSEDLINIGAYVPGNNPKLDKAIALKDSLDQLLRQEIDDNTPMEDTIKRIQELADRI